MSDISSKRADTRRRLREAALHVIAKEGFAGASIEMIVEAAGFTRGAFYSNFQTKEELFAEVIDAGIRKRLTAVAQAARQLERDPKPAISTPEGLAEVFRQVVADPDTEREWQIALAEYELFLLRNPESAITTTHPTQALVEEIVELVSPLFEAWGVSFTSAPEGAVKLLVNGYLGSVRESLFLGAAGPEGSRDHAGEDWFGALVERLVQFSRQPPNSSSVQWD